MGDFDLFCAVWQARSASGAVTGCIAILMIGSSRLVKKIALLTVCSSWVISVFMVSHSSCFRIRRVLIGVSGSSNSNCCLVVLSVGSVIVGSKTSVVIATGSVALAQRYCHSYFN